VDRYLSFFIRMVIVFGIGFLTPLFIVGLNMLGILSGKRLASAWRYIIFGVFVFAAVATPTGDPITMAVLAAPVLVLVAAAVGFSMLNDRRRRRNGAEPDYDQFDDDEISPLPESVDSEDVPRG
ncbi:MAG: twin-arginine translocase subunit TatC, partial [Candidatus Nanopelagicales bacterium]|nr:twin-arginine translocase subunit TatC [Candidatus Nanopelagicales bacterium]